MDPQMAQLGTQDRLQNRPKIAPQRAPILAQISETSWTRFWWAFGGVTRSDPNPGSENLAKIGSPPSGTSPQELETGT